MDRFWPWSRSSTLPKSSHPCIAHFVEAQKTLHLLKIELLVVADETHPTVLRVDQMLGILTKMQTNAILNNLSAGGCMACSELQTLVPNLELLELYRSDTGLEKVGGVIEALYKQFDRVLEAKLGGTEE